jgi:hypothetical protein
MITQTFFNFVIAGKKYKALCISVNGSGEKINQDSYELYVDDHNFICVIADGLGSAIHSNIGSKTICEVTKEVLLSDCEINEIGIRIKDQFKSKFSERIEDYDSTLRFARLNSSGLTLGSIGDGWTHFLSGNEYHTIESDAIFLNITDSILSREFDKFFKIESFDVPQHDLCISMMTDGYSEDFDKATGRKFLKKVRYEFMNYPREFCESNRKLLTEWPIKSNHDDKTICYICGGR